MGITRKGIWIGGTSLALVVSCMQPASPQRLLHLSKAQPHKPDKTWELRIPTDVVLDSSLARPLCTEFTFVEIRNRRQFEGFCRQIGLQPAAGQLDFHAGGLVGVAAAVGQKMEDEWPLTIENIRMYNGAAWIEARFHAGTYYPLSTSSYCTLTYVPGLKEVLAVEINRRTFLAQ